MIRFVDLRAADIAGARFAFFDTVPDWFVTLDNDQAWATWAEFSESWDTATEQKYPRDRFRSLCPAWVFEPANVPEEQKSRVRQACQFVREARALLAVLPEGENDHLIANAQDGLGSAQGYLETYEHRLYDPDAG